MKAKKLYNHQDRNLDRELAEIYNRLRYPGRNLPVFADNAAALAGGLVAGEEYRTTTGVRMVVY
jgi:hypothetical protein